MKGVDCGAACTVMALCCGFLRPFLLDMLHPISRYLNIPQRRLPSFGATNMTKTKTSCAFLRLAHVPEHPNLPHRGRITGSSIAGDSCIHAYFLFLFVPLIRHRRSSFSPHILSFHSAAEKSARQDDWRFSFLSFPTDVRHSNPEPSTSRKRILTCRLQSRQSPA